MKRSAIRGAAQAAGTAPDFAALHPGSLTTPPCSEVVEWLVLTDPIQVAAADVAGFAKLYPMNARPAQKDNRRYVLQSI